MAASSAFVRATARLNKRIVVGAPPGWYHRPQHEQAFMMAGVQKQIVVAVDDDRRVRESIQGVVDQPDTRRSRSQLHSPSSSSPVTRMMTFGGTPSPAAP
jgi:hypothetical protein